MNLPNFLIIGAAKSGTSALYRYMKQHPDIYMSPIKETHFFSYKDSPPNTRGPGDTINRAITDFDTYKSLFAGVTNELAIGEASPTYIYNMRAPLLIKQILPEARLITILRQPADRAFSAFMHVIRDKREPEKDFSKALELEQERINQNWGPIWHYEKGGYYFDQLSRYYNLFDRQQIRVYLHDEFSANPKLVLQDIFRFLGVDDQYIPDVSMKANVSGIQKSETADWMMERLFNRTNPLRYIARQIVSEDLRWRVTASVRGRNLNRPVIPPDIRVDLTARYREDILNLQKLIDRDLMHWLEKW